MAEHLKSDPTRLILAGMSGAGKSSVLRALGAHLPHYRCVDLDDLAGAGFPSIGALVNQLGWPAFRAREKAALESVLRSPGPWVLALGGGALVEGHELVSRAGATAVYLQCPFEICWQRIQHDPSHRPLVSAGRDELAQRFFERRPLFEALPHRVDATAPTEQVALAILRLVGLA